MTDYRELRDEVAATARRLADEGLLIGTAGNVSARSGDAVAVTATGVVLGNCVADEVSIVRLDGTQVSGRLAPTSELGLHLGVYAAYDAQAIVHTHAPFCTAVSAVSGLTALPVLHYQQLLIGGEIPIAPYATFGTPELAAAVIAALSGRQAALMANHGSVAIGASLDKAVDNALLLEWAAALYQRTCAMGVPRRLTLDEQQATVVQAISLRYGSTKEHRE